MNTFRKLQVQCAMNNVPIEVPQRAGQNVDHAGSLNDVTVRKEPNMAGLASYGKPSMQGAI